MTKGFYQRANPVIERRLEVAAEANLKLDAALEDGVVKVAAQVVFDKAALEKAAPPAKAEPQPAGEAKDAAKGVAKSNAPVYKLHVLLVEEMLRYPGENGIRLHPVVVRAMGGLMANGFVLDPAKAEAVNARFDLAAISDALKKYLEGFEASRSKDRDEPYTFSEKKHEINSKFLGLFTGALAGAQEKGLNPVTWSLKAVNATGGPLTAEVTAKIEDGWHLYSLTPIADGPKPTRITLPRDQGFELAGEIEAPEPFVKTDPNFGVEVEYYEESVTFKLPLKRRAGAGEKLLVEARYQTCTNRLCLPPKTVRLEAEVK
ncbi:MAG: protein-disulfide reductase DsbD N-terminal domain-containing protein [Blastocatellia bacterium]